MRGYSKRNGCVGGWVRERSSGARRRRGAAQEDAVEDWADDG